MDVSWFGLILHKPRTARNANIFFVIKSNFMLHANNLMLGGLCAFVTHCILQKSVCSSLHNDLSNIIAIITRRNV